MKDEIKCVCRGEDDKISLVDYCDLDVLVFLQWDGKGNSNRVIPSFSILDWVKISEDWRHDDTLPSDNSYYCGLSSEIEILSNFWIKV